MPRALTRQLVLAVLVGVAAIGSVVWPALDGRRWDSGPDASTGVHGTVGVRPPVTGRRWDRA